MSSIKKRKKKKVVEPPKMSMYDSIPDDIKISFGKFYVYSMLYVLFFGLLYPYVIMFYLNKIFTVILFILLILLYGYIVYDTKKKTGKFISTMYFFLIMLVVLSISLSIIKLVF